MTPFEKRWAERSPTFTAGQQVYAYIDNTPCKIVGPDLANPGYWLVLADGGTGKNLSIAWENLLTTPE